MSEIAYTLLPLMLFVGLLALAPLLADWGRRIDEACGRWLLKETHSRPSRWPQLTENDVLCALYHHGSLTSEQLFLEIAKVKRWSFADRFLIGWNAVNPILYLLSRPMQPGHGLVQSKVLSGPAVGDKVTTTTVWFLTRPKGYRRASEVNCTAYYSGARKRSAPFTL